MKQDNKGFAMIYVTMFLAIMCSSMALIHRDLAQSFSLERFFVEHTDPQHLENLALSEAVRLLNCFEPSEIDFECSIVAEFADDQELFTAHFENLKKDDWKISLAQPTDDSTDLPGCAQAFNKHE